MGTNLKQNGAYKGIYQFNMFEKTNKQNDKLEIALCGTPEFACSFFEEARKHFNIKFVITQCSKAQNRGYKFQPSAVAKWALKNQITCFEIDKITNGATYDIVLLEKLLKETDCVLLLAFGKIIPSKWLNMPRLGWLNIHPSKLPEFRGPSPLQYAILKGLSTSGLTLMKMDEGMDTGNIIAQQDFLITQHDTSASLIRQLSIWGPKWAIKNMYDYLNGKVEPIKQMGEVTYSYLVKKSDYILNVAESAEIIRLKIRAFGYVYSCDHDFKIFACQANSQNGFQINVGNGTISPIYVQRPGKRMMHVRNFLNGLKKTK